MSISFETLALAKRYTRDAVADAIGGITTIDFRFVETLPLVGEAGVIYCVPVNNDDASDLYDEYYYINGRFERLPGVRIDLTPYATKNWVTGEGYYKKPSDGIPGTDLDAATRAAIAKAETALQEHQSLEAYRTAIQQDEHDAAYIEKLDGIEAHAQVNVDEISVGNTQPGDPNVKLWMYQNPGQKIEIPTMEDFRNLKPATDEQVSAAVSNWLEENISGGETIAVDKSLSVEGAAADAKTVGELKSTFEESEIIIPEITTGNLCSISTDIYSLGAIISGANSGDTIIRTGHNIWDENWEQGYYNVNDGNPVNFNGRIRSKNPIFVFPDMHIYFTIGTGSLYILGYKQDGSYENGAIVRSTPSGDFVVPAGIYYLKIYSSTAYGGTYNNDICLSFESGAYQANHVETYTNTQKIDLIDNNNYIYSSTGANLTAQYYVKNNSLEQYISAQMPKLKILSYNIRAMRGGEQGAGNGPLTDEQTAETLHNFKSLFQKINPDIFIACEDRKYFDAGATEVSGGIRSVYDELYEHYFPHKYNPGGAAVPHIYSKYPILESLIIPVTYEEGLTNRRYPTAIRIEVGGRSIWVIGVHPAAGPEVYTTHRVPYFNAILDFVANKNYAIIAGDFNTSSASPESELQPFISANMQLGNMGYFGKFATYRFGTEIYLDNIITKGFTQGYYMVGDETYSDHFPTYSELNVRL